MKTSGQKAETDQREFPPFNEFEPSNHRKLSKAALSLLHFFGRAKK